jgi:hypothetical protein
MAIAVHDIPTHCGALQASLNKCLSDFETAVFKAECPTSRPKNSLTAEWHFQESWFGVQPLNGPERFADDSICTWSSPDVVHATAGACGKRIYSERQAVGSYRNC